MTHAVGLPGGWVQASLAELVEHQAGNSKLIKGRLAQVPALGLLPGFSASGLNVWLETWDHEGDAVVVSAVGARCGKAFYATGRWSAIANTHVVKPSGAVDARLLWYRLNDEGFWIRSGTAQPFVLVKKTLETSFNLPPLAEQHRIVEAIESYLTRLDNAVALLERVEWNLKRYRAAVLNAAVEGRLVSTEAELARREGRSYEPASELLKRILGQRKARWIEDAAERTRAKAEEKARKARQPWTAADDAVTLEKERAKAAKQYKEPAALDTTDLPALPEGWSYMSVGQFCAGGANSIKRGPFGSALRKEFFVPLGFKVYEQQHAIRNDFSIGSYYVDQEKFEELRAFEVCPGDLIVSCSGTIGRVAVMPEWAERGIINQALLKLTLDRRVMSSAFFIISFQALAAQLVADTSRGTGMQNLSGVKELKQIGFPVPPPNEQERIVAAVERQDSAIRVVHLAVGQALRRAQRLRQAILKWAFEGRLVEQNPNDEPASVLLERIKAQRAQVERRVR